MKFDIAYLCPGTVNMSFANSLAETVRQNPETKIYAALGKKLILQKNVSTRRWLKDSEKDWLLWADADMSWSQGALASLLKTAARGPGVYSGLWFHYSNTHNIYPGFFVERGPDGKLLAVMNTYCKFPRDRAFEVAGTGGGFFLVHREVLEALGGDTEYPFFRARLKDPIEGYAQYFSKKVIDAGFKVWVDPLAAVWHHEAIPLDRQHYDAHWRGAK